VPRSRSAEARRQWSQTSGERAAPLGPERAQEPERPRPAPPPGPPPAPAPEPPAPEPPAPPAAEAATALPLHLDEEGARALLDQLAERFGWAVAVVGRAEVEAALGRGLSAEEWRRVRSSRWWSGGVPGAMTTGAADLLPTMLAALGLTEDDEE
jgi:hypothetical protein